MDAAKGTKECSVVNADEFLEKWSEDEGNRDDLVMLDDVDLNSSDTTTDAAELLSQTSSDHVICRENRSPALKTACDKRLIDAVLRRKTKHVAPKWKSTYAGRKHEVAELQGELQKLQDKLSWLQAGQTRTTASSTALTARQFSSTSIVTDNVVFEKRLAGRKRELLFQSVLKNEKLRTFLADQRLMAKSLHRILMRRVEKAALLEDRLRPASPEWSQRGIVSGDELVFSSLLEKSAFMEPEANRIAHTLQSRLPWPQSDSSFRQLNVTRSGPENQLYLEIVNSEEVPSS